MSDQHSAGRPAWLTDDLLERCRNLEPLHQARPVGPYTIKNALGISIYRARCVWEILKAERRADLVSGAEPPPPAPGVVLAAQVERVRNRERALEARERAYYELLAGAVRAFPPYHAPARAPRQGAGNPETAVLLLSDFHAGEVVRPEEIAGVNEYDSAILATRLELLAEKVAGLVEFHRRYADVRRLVVGLLGDMTSGTIHEELERGADLTAVEQPALAGWLTACVIAELARTFDEVEVRAVVGNHGRLKQKPYYKQAFNSYDFQAYQLAALWLRDVANVRFELGRNVFDTVDIEGWRFLFTHGHTVRGWGGIPFYGLERAFANAQKRNQYAEAQRAGDLRAPVKPVHFACIGHFHTEGDIPHGYGHTIMNGSPKGADEFGSILGKFGRPNQRLFGVSPEYGVTFNYPVWLDQAPPKAPGRFAARLPDCWADLAVS